MIEMCILSPSDTCAFPRFFALTSCRKEQSSGDNVDRMLKHSAVIPAASPQSCVEPSHLSARSRSDLAVHQGPPHSCTPARATKRTFKGSKTSGKKPVQHNVWHDVDVITYATAGYS